MSAPEPREHNVVATVAEGRNRFWCLDCHATSHNRPPTGPCPGDKS